MPILSERVWLTRIPGLANPVGSGRPTDVKFKLSIVRVCGITVNCPPPSLPAWTLVAKKVAVMV